MQVSDSDGQIQKGTHFYCFLVLFLNLTGQYEELELFRRNISKCLLKAGKKAQRGKTLAANLND